MKSPLHLTLPQTTTVMRVRKVAARIRLIRAGHPIGFLPRRGKNYLNDLLCLVAPEDGFTQDALEWGVMVRQYVPFWTFTYHPEHDAEKLAIHCEIIVGHYRAAASTAGTELLIVKLAA